MKTADDFRKSVKENSMEKCIYKFCTTCKQPLHWRFINDAIFLDENCNCTKGLQTPKPKTYESLVDWYNSKSDLDSFFIDALFKFI